MCMKFLILFFIIFYSSGVLAFVGQKCVNGVIQEEVKILGTKRCKVILERTRPGSSGKITIIKYLSSKGGDCDRPAQEEVSELISKGYSCVGVDSVVVPVSTPVAQPVPVQVLPVVLPTPKLTPDPYPMPKIAPSEFMMGVSSNCGCF